MPPDSRSASRVAERHQPVSSSSRVAARREVAHAVDPREERDVLVDGQIAVQAEPLRHVADRRASPCGGRETDRRQARARVPASGASSPQISRRRRRLARAVRTDDAEHLAAADVEASARRPPCVAPNDLRTSTNSTTRSGRSRPPALPSGARELDFDRHARLEHALPVVDGHLHAVHELRALGRPSGRCAA